MKLLRSLFIITAALLLSLAGSALAAENGRQSTPASEERSPDGWETVESGSRPVYVGIHGGTAQVTVMRDARGKLFAFTGKTGNDFVSVLRGNASIAESGLDDETGNPSGAAIDEASVPTANAWKRIVAKVKRIPSPDSAEPHLQALPSSKNGGTAPVALSTEVEFASPGQGMDLSAKQELVPFGLSLPGEAKIPAALNPADAPQIFPPVKLGSYKKILSRQGPI